MAKTMDKADGWRARREATGLGLNEVARRAKVNQSYLSMIEHGRMVPTAAEAEAILRVLTEAEQKVEEAV